MLAFFVNPYFLKWYQETVYFLPLKISSTIFRIEAKCAIRLQCANITRWNAFSSVTYAASIILRANDKLRIFRYHEFIPTNMEFT